MNRKYEKPQIGYTKFRSVNTTNNTVNGNANFGSEIPKGVGTADYSKVKPLAK